MSDKTALGYSLTATEQAIDELEAILAGDVSAVLFCADPNIERSHRNLISDADLSVVSEKYEARILLPAFRKLRDAYKSRIDARRARRKVKR